MKTLLKYLSGATPAAGGPDASSLPARLPSTGRRMKHFLGRSLTWTLAGLLGLAGTAQAQEFTEDFTGNWTGQLNHVWGESSKVSVSGGVVTIGGTHNGAGVMQLPGAANSGLGNGLFEIRAQLRGSTVGSNSGPALVLWPADDKWTAKSVENAGGTFPYHLSREVDIGEIDGGGKTYMASHWTDCSWNRPECDAYKAFYAPEGHNQWEWHTYAAFLQKDKITYYVDGKVIGVDTDHPSPDFASGGVNHLIGLMNRSSDTELRADWVKWTSEATVLKNGGPYGGTTPPPPSPSYAGTYVLVAGHSGKALDADGTQNGGKVQQWALTGGKNQNWTLTADGAGFYTITNVNSGKVLDVEAAFTADGAKVHQWDNFNSDNQKWKVEDAGNGFVKLTAKHSGKALDVSEVSTADGAQVHQWAYVGGANQKWKLQAPTTTTPPPPTTATYAGRFVLTARHSGKALDVENASTDNGGRLQQWENYSGKNQIWTLTATTDGYYTITNEHSGKVLDVQDVSPDNGANVHQWENFGADNQLWKVEDVGGGYVKITAKHSGKSLDVWRASQDNGAQLVQWDYVGGVNQQWKLQAVGTTPTAPNPPTQPNPATASVINILVRGQSNAIYFMESNGWAGAATLEREVQRLLGFDGTKQKVRLVYDRGEDDGAATAFGGTPFIGNDWVAPKNGDWRQGWEARRLENMVLGQINQLSAAEKAAPAAVLWLHSENDSKRSDLTPEEWMSAVRFDANLVRQAWGKSAADLPYLFVDAHPYWGTNEGHQAIRQGMERLAKDASFNADIASRALDLDINRDNYDGNESTQEYGGSHLADSDILLLAPRIARVVAEQFAQYAASGSPVAQAGGNLNDHGPQVVGATLVGSTQLRLTVKHDGSAAGFKALDSDAANGVGWSVHSAGGSVNATKAQIVDGTHLLLTFNGTVPANGKLYYGYGYGRLEGADKRGQGNAVYDTEGLPIWVSADGLSVGTGTQNRSTAQAAARATTAPASLTIYPNPAHDYVMVSLQATANEPVVVEVRDALARRVTGLTHRATGGLNQVRLPLGKLPAGVYHVSVQCGAKRTVQRLTVAP
ncbi:RICIN domain-containing protein [Hymenobacter weizhouensis]|uniref:RICIN domain-containing protein n=1 Tax=Hymenobacter sp. YIM 151500-1 TaxID=2987689 RepID=UPI002225DF69|nr:RICIN domain-containing protein [Hymenobacter sp. YIM 151500-1]UYZ62935.1 RICIN domain-containing protein [Hymenobacter sp. YIM 151500-1]